MPVFKYKDPQTGEWINVAGGGGGAANIPIQDEPPASGDLWVDTSEEGAGGSGEVNFDGVANEYVWEKVASTLSEQLGPTLGEIDFSESPIEYSDSIDISSGSPVLVNPVSGYGDDIWGNPVGKYIKFLEDSTGYGDALPDFAKCTGLTSQGWPSLQEVTVAGSGEVISYVNSSDPNAYPINDGFTYVSKGQLGANVQIATGSYTGTGTSGSSNKNSLTFDFEPAFVAISSSFGFFAIKGATESQMMVTGSASTFNITYAFNDNTFSWYASDAQKQANTSGEVYHYFAIG